VRRADLVQSGAYVVVGTLSVAAALAVSLNFIGRIHAQDSPPPTSPAVTAPAPAPTPTDEPVASQPGADAATSAAPPPPPPSAPAAAAAAPAAPTEVNPAAAAQQDVEADNRPGHPTSELEGFLEPFIYDIVNRRDPFMPYAEFAPENTGNGRPLTPAQRFDLDQLKLIGIMWDVKDPKAMFQDPDKEVMVLGRDEGIGNRNGYIAAIREGEVVVVEALRKRGDIIYKTKVLRIER
jgi:type IV pilus assembly protein PilP